MEFGRDGTFVCNLRNDEFWLTDESPSTCVRSAGLSGLEMHAPIMCIGNGVPAIVCRFAEQTTRITFPFTPIRIS